VSDAEIAEIPYSAFASRKGQAITARLIVRRVRDLSKAAAGQGELFPAWRYHPVFTDSPVHAAPGRGPAPRPRRDRAGVRGRDQRSAGAPAPGRFAANAAWLTLAAIAHNLMRAAGCATIRADLISVAARTGRGCLTLHLPLDWHRETEWMSLFQADCGPPARAA
jgi:hypothetical protein